MDQFNKEFDELNLDAHQRSTQFSEQKWNELNSIEDNEKSIKMTDNQNHFKFKEDNFDKQFFKSLNKFRSDQLFCDISIKIDDKIIKAHRIVMASTIPYFEAMFSSNMLENLTNTVEIKDDEISYSTFEKIVDYAYSGEIILNLDNVQQICLAASFLCIKSVLNACIQFICKNLNHKNVLEYKSFGKYFPELEFHIENYINEEFLYIYKTKEFLELSNDDILKIISNSELNVDEEKTVFEAVMLWVKADEENRKQYLCSLLEQIRLPFVSSEFIVDNIISESLVKKCLTCRDLIDEAKDWHLLPQRRNLIQNHRTIKRSFTKKETPILAIGSLEGKTYFEVYDTIKDQWKIYLTEQRFLKLRTSITSLKNKVYYIGGYENGIRTNNVEVFDLVEKNWSQIASLNKKRSALTSVSLDDKIYCCGGFDGKASLSSAECYSLKLNKWSYISDMNKPRCSSAAVVCNNSIYVIGGHDGTTIFKSVERYDPLFDKWVLCKDMAKERCRSGATSLGGLIYVAGGFNQYDDDSFEVYDPHKNCWKSLSPMLKPRSRLSLIANGKKIYAIGGYVQNSFTNTCEVYDIETDKWKFVSSMNAKQNPTGTLLFNCTSLPKKD